MNKRYIKALSLIIISLLSVNYVFAASGGFFQNNPMLRSLIDMLSEPVNWPPWNATPGLPLPTQTVPFYVILLTWIALYAVLYVLANSIPPFKDSPHKGAITWFAIAFSGIAVTSTSFVNNVAALLDFTQGGLVFAGVFAILFILVGIGFSGSKLGLGMAWPSKFGDYRTQLQSVNENREKDAARRDAKLEQTVYRREDEGIKEAENLLRNNINNIHGDEPKLRHLLKIIEELQKVRDEGEARRLRDGFQRQASAVLGHLSTTSDVDRQLADLTSRLQQIVDLDFNYERDLMRRLDALRRLARTAPLGAGAQTLYNNLERAQRALVTLRQNRDELSRRIQTAVNQIGPDDRRIQNIMEAAIRDVYKSNYPSAIELLNQAINGRTDEANILAEINNLLNESQTFVRSEQSLNTRIRRLLA
ncbi:hypothetical protein HYU11_01675 [Candidatus Woesearchaeota archaeon]|nr:hypothetical protein [Candidatus Woesearchaeota archaeon]